MDWQRGMSQAIDYIEKNLTSEINLEIAAKYAGCSLWEFQRVFSFITHISLGEYVRRRKLSLAADDLRAGEEKIIDIALKYGYDSPAAFSRAFSQLHGMPPSLARNKAALLKRCQKITFETNGMERVHDMKERNNMEAYSERGYYVKENAPVYFTKDMDKTCAWFHHVLGWYGDVVARDDTGRGEYGCVFDYPGELIVAQLTPFRGIHLFHGEPIKGIAGFIMVQGLEKLHKFVTDNGWNQISGIEPQPWGAKECSITTIDGCIIRFFESIQ